jgi:hypothetical protein
LPVSYGYYALLIFLAMLVAFSVATNIFFYLGQKLKTRYTAEEQQLLSVLQTAALTLVAILLAFGVSIAEVRFENRLTLLADEGNAIGTAHLRTELLPENKRRYAKQLLAEYLQARIDFYYLGAEPDQMKKIREKTRKIEDSLWQLAMAAARQYSSFTTIPLFVQSMNEMFDLREKQNLAFSIHVPKSITALLIISSLFVLAGLGFIHGVAAEKHFRVFSMILILIVTLTLFVIIDLDRPRGGFIKIRPINLLMLKENFSA